MNSLTRQALLILLPLLLLTALGIASLRQDRILARQAAMERARALAESLLPGLWKEVRATALESKVQFRVDRNSRLVHPPRAEPAELLPALQISADIQGRQLFQEALNSLNKGETNRAIPALLDVFTNHPEARGETGLRLGALAAFRLLDLKPFWPDGPELQHITIDSVCSNLVAAPHPLSGLLLDRLTRKAGTAPEQASAREWKHALEAQERATEAFDETSAANRDLWNAPAISRFGPPPMPVSSIRNWQQRQPQRTTTPGSRMAPVFAIAQATFYLIPTGSNDTTRTFAVVSGSDLGNRVEKYLGSYAGVPNYMKCSVDVAGEALSWFEVAPASRGRFGATSTSKQRQAAAPGPPAELLASIALPDGSVDVIRMSFFLSDTSALYAQQRARTYWFAGLIAVSSGAAMLGLLGAWKSFREQERLGRLKSDFVSSVSHELRAPIASVRLMAENLERGRVLEESRRMDYFRFIGQECRRLSGLIENVLDFSRIEQGRKQYEFEVCDLARIVESTVRLMHPVASERQVTLKVSEQAPKSPVHRRVDGKAIQQALVNLVDNAIKHSSPGSDVTVGLSAPDGAKAAELWVEDSGKGIPASEHDRIFERFYRLGSELRRETQGVGIGLSIVKHVVDAHRGRIHVRSAPGQGSRFTIRLPEPLEDAPEKSALAGQ